MNEPRLHRPSERSEEPALPGGEETNADSSLRSESQVMGDFHQNDAWWGLLIGGLRINHGQ
jgi:hypothetical protein